VSFENVSRQFSTAEEPVLTAVAVNRPVARADPLGFGTSWRAFRTVRTDATEPSCARISPPRFVGVWTLTYVPPFWSAASTVASSSAVPVAPLVHGPQSDTDTGPGCPGAPVWIWAATASPVRLLKVSRH